MSNEIILRGETQRSIAIQVLTQLRIDPDRPIVLTLEPLKKKRSLRQNALYWKRIGEIVQAISHHTGNDADELHIFFKQKYLQPIAIEVAGETIFYWTTTKLTTAEMATYMTQIEAFAAAEGVLLTHPEDRRAA